MWTNSLNSWDSNEEDNSKKNQREFIKGALSSFYLYALITLIASIIIR